MAGTLGYWAIWLVLALGSVYVLSVIPILMQYDVIAGKAFPARLGLLCDGLDALLDAWRPDVVAIETVFMDKNATSALKLGHARGAALATVVRRKLAIHEYSPRLIKQSLVGRGAAEKAQVQHMVRLLLNLADAKLQADAADALAVALTHAHMSATAMRTGVGVAMLRRR